LCLEIEKGTSAPIWWIEIRINETPGVVDERMMSKDTRRH
jgi:hypothetical protein